MCSLGWSCDYITHLAHCAQLESENRVTMHQQLSVSSIPTQMSLRLFAGPTGNGLQWASQMKPFTTPWLLPFASSLCCDDTTSDDQAAKADAWPKHDGCCEGATRADVASAWAKGNSTTWCQRGPPVPAHLPSPIPTQDLSMNFWVGVEETWVLQIMLYVELCLLPLDLGSFSPTWTCVLRFLLRTFLGRLLRDPSIQPSKLDRIQVWTQLRLILGPPDTFNNEESPQ